MDGGGSYAGHNSHNSQMVTDQSSKLFATNFFANVSYAYDSLLCILKYLKVHVSDKNDCHIKEFIVKLFSVVVVKGTSTCRLGLQTVEFGC